MFFASIEGPTRPGSLGLNMLRKYEDGDTVQVQRVYLGQCVRLADAATS